MILDGDKLILYAEKDGVLLPICGGTACSLNVNREIKKATKAPGSKWASNYSGEMSYTLSAAGLCVMGSDKNNHRDLLDKMILGEPFIWVMRSLDNTQDFYTGTALIDTWKIDGNYGDGQRYAVTAIGDGEMNPINPYEIQLFGMDNNSVLGTKDELIIKYKTGGLPPIKD